MNSLKTRNRMLRVIRLIAWRAFVGVPLLTAAASTLASLWLWHRTYTTMDIIIWHETNSATTTFISDCGVLIVQRKADTEPLARTVTTFYPVQRRSRTEFEPLSRPQWNHGATASHPPVGRPRGYFYKFERNRAFDGTMVQTLDFAVPYWAIGSAGAAIILLVIIGYLMRRRRYAKGRCQNCGYDLRATPNLCPECGTPTDRSATS